MGDKDTIGHGYHYHVQSRFCIKLPRIHRCTIDWSGHFKLHEFEQFFKI